jgi:predicted dehydrogenase
MLVAVADPDPARCAAVAPGVDAFGDSAELVASAPVDAVVVATPAEAHLSAAAAAAAVGVPALVEKPPAADLAEGRALAALEPQPTIGFNRRFDERLRSLRSRLPAGSELELRLRFRYRRAGWAAHVAADDALLDVGTHLVDLARWLTRSDVARVRATLVRPDRAQLELELGHGRVLLECNASAPYSELAAARDAAGRRIGRAHRGGVVDRGLARLTQRRPLVFSLAAQLEAFLAELRGGAVTDLATAADGVAALEAIEAARRSAAAGGSWTDVDEGRA